MAALAKQLEQGSMGDLTHPVVDATGLEGAWDFELTWAPHVLAAAGTNSGTRRWIPPWKRRSTGNWDRNWKRKNGR